MNQEYVGCVLWGQPGGIMQMSDILICIGFIEILVRVGCFKGITQCEAQAVFCCCNRFTHCGTGQAKFSCDFLLRHSFEKVQNEYLILLACQRFCHA